MISHGENICGHTTTAIQTASTAMTPVLHRAKQPVRHISAVQGYLQLAKEGRYEDALALIKKDNPLPAVCGHVCNRRCEDACTRGTIDEAVAIDEVKRFIAERDLNAETRFIPKKTIPSLKGRI